MLLLFVSREKSKDLLDWCYCLFFSFFSFEEARLQVPIARHPCSVISISYDQKKKKKTKKKIIAQNDTFLTHALKKFGMLAKSQASPITHVT